MNDTILNELLVAAREHAGGEGTEPLRRLSNAFLTRARADPTMLKAAAEALPTLPPAAAAWIAVLLGAAIETGTGVELTAPGIVRVFLSWLPKLPTPPPVKYEEGVELPEPTPEQAPWLEAFPDFCRSVVSHLARMPEQRTALARDEDLLARLERLEPYTHGATWVREMLMRSSGTLIILHAASGRGFKLHYRDVARCFHLFSLIQIAIGTRLPDGREPDPAVVAAVRGDSRENVSDVAWWHYGDPRSKAANLQASIWGEAMTRSIPVVNGAQVMLLWPPLLQSRSWSHAFFGPHLDALPADVSIEEELSPESVQSWLETLGVKSRSHRRWWWPW